MKKYLVMAGSVLLILVLALFSVFRYFHSPYDRQHISRPFVIKNGETLHSVSFRLAQGGFLRYPALFAGYLTLKGLDQKIKAGYYMPHSSMTPLEILDTLITGLVSIQGITIPEGYTVEQIGLLLENEGIVEKSAILEASHDPDLLRTMKVSADSMEGYLFPDTYQIYRGMTSEEIVRIMVRRFREVITPEMKKRCSEMGWDLHDVVTLASIIEKETPREDERPMIASVLMNRLKNGMHLQSDPTVIYCVSDFNGNLAKANLEEAILYSTYVFKGLPPGPISNPGLASIKATLYPARTPYLFYVSRNDGSHEFSVTMKDHNQAVSRYQNPRKLKRNPRH